MTSADSGALDFPNLVSIDMTRCAVDVILQPLAATPNVSALSLAYCGVHPPATTTCLHLASHTATLRDAVFLDTLSDSITSIPALAALSTRPSSLRFTPIPSRGIDTTPKWNHTWHLHCGYRSWRLAAPPACSSLGGSRNSPLPTSAASLDRGDGALAVGL